MGVELCITVGQLAFLLFLTTAVQRFYKENTTDLTLDVDHLWLLESGKYSSISKFALSSQK